MSDNLFAAFATLTNAMGNNPGGDAGSIIPESDARDMRNGAEWIPSEVTDERRAGKTVTFTQPTSDSNTWYWTLSTGEVIKHP